MRTAEQVLIQDHTKTEIGLLIVNLKSMDKGEHSTTLFKYFIDRLIYEGYPESHTHMLAREVLKDYCVNFFIKHSNL